MIHLNPTVNSKKIMQYTINGLIQLSLQEANLKFLNTIKPHLLNDVEVPYVDFINTYVKKYNKPPTLEIFLDKFASFRLSNLDDMPLQYYYDELKPIILSNYIENRNKQQKDKGLSITESDYIVDLSEKVKLANPEFVVYSELDRGDYFKNIKLMSYGLGFLDEWFGSLVNTDLIGIFGRLKSNKTTFLQIIGYVLYYKEKRNILVFSNENSPLQFAQVFDAFLGNFNNKNFRTLDTNILDSVKDKIEKVVKPKIKKAQGEIILAGAARTPSDIIAAIRNCEVKPDVILLDGLHAMSFNSKDTGSQSLSVAETMKQLKQIISDYGIPIIFVTQANRTSSKTDEPGAESVSLSDSIPQYVDGLMGCTLVEMNGKTYCKIFCTANRYGAQKLSKFMEVNYDTRQVKFYDLEEDSELIVQNVNDDEYVENLKDDDRTDV